ncbi:MAG: nucleotide-binding protein [Myxococcota bacterium]|nr:nucleotide-binding protein [Myxococcota bacterium]
MNNALRAALVTATLLSLAGCKEEAAVPASVAATPVPTAQGALVGTIAERLDAASYTYLRLQTAGGESWVAVPATNVAVGTRVTIQDPKEMGSFESKTLGRTFSQITFGSAALAEGATPSVAPRPAPSPAPGAIKVAKATGNDARTVAEVFAQRAALKDKPVSVRGRVVKVTAGVLNRNWLHVRDGSGAEATLDHDLIVTTTAEVQVNEELTLTGVVHTDKDLGSGYSYKVLVEDATVSR